jgi:predicted enzyme related to lactoylglutathione lyase
VDQIKFVVGFLLSSADPKRLAAFYRDVLNIPLKESTHGGTAAHFECDLGNVHFAIHPIYPGQPKPVNTSARIGFAVFDIDKAQDNLKSRNIKFYGPTKADYGTSIALIDPDGNPVDLYELSKSHIEEIEKHQGEFDLIAEWKRSQK